MHNAVEAYNANSKATQDPRELEASLLLKAAAHLQNIRDNWDEERASLYDALYYNRKLWTIFAAAMAEEDNELPQNVRNNIASLAVYIMDQTVKIQAAPEAGKLTSLININKEIAAGLNASEKTSSS